jgi:predicted cation transporter
MLAPPPAEPPVLRKAIIRTVITAVILVAGLILTLVGLNYSEKLARQKARAAGAAGARDAMVPAGFEVSAIALEKGQGSAGIFAVGTVVNTSSRPRSRVTVEFDLVDARGEKVEVARAYRPTLEAGAKWEIKVPVAEDTKAVSARLASIKEEP